MLLRDAAASVAGEQRGRQGRHRRLPRQAFDPYTLYPTGDDMDMNKMSRIKIDDLQMRPEVFSHRLRRRARLRTPSTKPCLRSTRPWPSST